MVFVYLAQSLIRTSARLDNLLLRFNEKNNEESEIGAPIHSLPGLIESNDFDHARIIVRTFCRAMIGLIENPKGISLETFQNHFMQFPLPVPQCVSLLTSKMIPGDASTPCETGRMITTISLLHGEQKSIDGLGLIPRKIVDPLHYLQSEEAKNFWYQSRDGLKESSPISLGITYEDIDSFGIGTQPGITPMIWVFKESGSNQDVGFVFIRKWDSLSIPQTKFISNQEMMKEPQQYQEDENNVFSSNSFSDFSSDDDDGDDENEIIESIKPMKYFSNGATCRFIGVPPVEEGYVAKNVISIERFPLRHAGDTWLERIMINYVLDQPECFKNASYLCARLPVISIDNTWFVDTRRAGFWHWYFKLQPAFDRTHLDGGLGTDYFFTPEEGRIYGLYDGDLPVMLRPFPSKEDRNTFWEWTIQDQ